MCFFSRHASFHPTLPSYSVHTSCPPPLFLSPNSIPSLSLPLVPFPHLSLPPSPPGHFLLTSLLLPKLKDTASASSSPSRIVILSSHAHNFVYSGGIRFGRIDEEAGYSAMGAYGQSKLANILHARELARRLKVGGAGLGGKGRGGE